MNFLNLDTSTSDKLFSHIKNPNFVKDSKLKIAIDENDYNLEDEVNDKF